MSYTKNPFNYFGTARKQYRLDIDKANENFTVLANAFKDNNPETKILKETDKVLGFHASQFPQSFTIPASNSDGKISNDWLYASQQALANTIPVAGSEGKLSLDWFPLQLPNTNTTNAPSTYNFDVVGDSDYKAVVNTTLNRGDVLSVNFSNVVSLVLNVSITSDVLLYIKLKVISNPPSSGVFTNPDIYLLPNNTTYPSQFFNAYGDKFYLGGNAGTIFGDYYIAKKNDFYSFAIGKVLYYSYTSYPQQTQYQYPPYTSYWNYYPQFFYPYTPSGVYTPWTILGTIYTEVPVNGRIIIKRLV